MSFPIRKIFAAALLLVALVPIALVTMHASDPIGNIVFWIQARDLAGQVGVYLAIAAIAAAILYPPAIPFLRLRFAQARRRLGTDRGPLMEGIARLRHLETHDERLRVGRLARQLGDTKVAVENLTRAFELDPSHASGRYQLALLLEEIGTREDAAHLLISLVNDDERHAFGEALFQLGRVLYRLRRDDEAIAALRRHLELFPGSREAQLLLARALADNGAIDEARQQLELAKRPPDEGQRLTPREALARAQAKVTFLRVGAARSGDRSEHA
ncbi:MAG: tetratricopeptide repeat protein [Planctomycetota bacterium]|nr:tetratricopeptide repeat protein [Planctomycetota bacterium]